MSHGHAADTRARQDRRRTLGPRPVPLDDRAAGDDHLVLVPALQSARSQSRLLAADAGPAAGRGQPLPRRPTNYYYFLTDPAFFKAMGNSLLLVGWVLVITVVGGTLLALLLDQADLWPQHRAPHGDRALLRHADGQRAGLEEHDDAPGVRASSPGSPSRLGWAPIDWFAHYPMTAIVIMVAWQWLPFATLILLTALQSLRRGAEGGGRDGRHAAALLLLVHRSCRISARPITVVILIETIFLLNVFAEIYVTGTGGPRGQPALPRLSIRPARQRRRRRLGGRHRRGHPRQHRRLLPDAHDRQEPGGLRPWHAQSPPAAS